MKKDKKSLGNWGEQRACEYLKSKKFFILKKNLRYPFGEVDILALKEDVLYFVEVKTRSSNSFGEGYEAVDLRKIQRIQKVAETYLCEEDLDKEVQVAVISILKTNREERIDFFLI